MNASEGICRYVVFNETDLTCCARQHDLSTEFGPLSDGCRTELMLLLGGISRNAANDVVCEEQNLHEFLVNLLKSSPMPN